MPGILLNLIEPPSPTSCVEFGATLSNVDVENLSDDDFERIREALYQNHVICIKSHASISPRAQADLTRRFDPTAVSYGHGKSLDAKRSVLHPDLKTIPYQPEVQVIGNGFIPEYEGLQGARLVHPHHKNLHKQPIPDDEDLEFTRFYRKFGLPAPEIDPGHASTDDATLQATRNTVTKAIKILANKKRQWHIDAALYDLNQPLVTSLLAVEVPKGRRQTLRYDDGSGEELDVPLGTTAFVSGYKMYDLLSDSQKQLVRTSKVEYAPHPYVWMSPAKSRSDGLGMVSDGLELPLSDLPQIDESKIQVLPMCWRNPVTGQYALQIHPSAVRKIHLKNGTVIDDLEKVREMVRELQRPAIVPQYVYPHDWDEGDLVLFNNHGVLHSVVGAFREDEVRLFRQCNLAASVPPVGPEE